MDAIADVVDQLGLEVDDCRPVTGPGSGSHVLAATRDSLPVICKITLHSDDALAAAAAHREFTVYLSVGALLDVRTPLLLDHATTATSTALVLTRHTPAPTAETWTEDDWVRYALTLADLHNSPCPNGDIWRRPPPRLLDHFGAEGDLIHTLVETPEDHVLLDRVLEQADALTRAAAALAPVFIHGDSHTGNVLTDQGRLLLADWQDARVGGQSHDLGFALARAVPSGAEPPVAKMLRRYAQSRSLDEATVTRAVLAAELETLTRAFPAYLGAQTPQGRRHLRAALRTLGHRWLSIT